MSNNGKVPSDLSWLPWSRAWIQLLVPGSGDEADYVSEASALTNEATISKNTMPHPAGLAFS